MAVPDHILAIQSHDVRIILDSYNSLPGKGRSKAGMRAKTYLDMMFLKQYPLYELDGISIKKSSQKFNPFSIATFSTVW